MTTAKFATEGKHQCGNCQKTWTAKRLKDIEDLEQRVEAGGEVPSGECPECGALCYPHVSKPPKKHKQANSISGYFWPMAKGER